MIQSDWRQDIQRHYAQRLQDLCREHLPLSDSAHVSFCGPSDIIWLVVWLWLSIQLGMSSSQLTNSIIFQRGRLVETCWNHQPVIVSWLSKFHRVSCCWCHRRVFSWHIWDETPSWLSHIFFKGVAQPLNGLEKRANSRKYPCFLGKSMVSS